MNRFFIILAGCVLLNACSSPSQQKDKLEKENLEAKSLLQGVWIDDMTEAPLLRIKGDTIHYINEAVAPKKFKIIGDSLKTYGQQVSSYHIKKQGEHIFWIESAIGDILQLSKADNAVDSLLPIPFVQSQERSKEVVQKDLVVYYNNTRYRGYVYINPTGIKVIQPGITEEGLEVENVFYDNIIHICVYEGKNRLFGRDMKKADFEPLLPEVYYQRSILADMDFIGVNEKGYQYQANLCIPNSASCYLINISITKNGDITYELVQ